MITNWTGTDLAKITKGNWHRSVPKAPCMTLAIDHRTLEQDGLFIALPGTKHDGHAFLDDLLPSHCALVKTPSPDSAAHQLCVADPLMALHDIARAAMADTKARKIAITGSVGKTSTKEALTSVLSCYGATHASSGNYNNHIGAPLSMARTPDEAEMILMEMGMNHAGEIAPLSHLYQADIAIITKIADSHRGHFNSTEDIAHAKAEIFAGMNNGMTGSMNNGTAILPFDDTHFALLASAAEAEGLTIISFGAKTGADIQLTSQTPCDGGQRLVIHNNLTDQDASFTLGLAAPHHSTTALIALASLHVLGLDWRPAEQALANLQEVEGRGNQLAIALDGRPALLINDSYNAGPASMAASLSYVATLPHDKKGLVLTDMLELGTISDAAHEALIPLIEAIAPHRLVLVGEAMGKIQNALAHRTHLTHYPHASQCQAHLTGALSACDLILVKGSNGSGAPALAKALISAANNNTSPRGAAHVS